MIYSEKSKGNGEKYSADIGYLFHVSGYINT